jgi:hypothetical protein
MKPNLTSLFVHGLLFSFTAALAVAEHSTVGFGDGSVMTENNFALASHEVEGGRGHSFFNAIEVCFITFIVCSQRYLISSTDISFVPLNRAFSTSLVLPARRIFGITHVLFLSSMLIWQQRREQTRTLMLLLISKSISMTMVRRRKLPMRMRRRTAIALQFKTIVAWQDILV